MSRGKKVDALIAGAGPVGLTAAIALARRGVGVEIFEKSSRTTTRSYALALHPASISLLDELGIAHTAFAQGHEIESLAFYEGENRHAGVRFGVTRGDHPCLVLPQAVLEEILLEELATMNVPVHWKHRVIRVTPASEGPARVTVAKLGGESLGYAVAESGVIVKREIDYDADVVLGTDGHLSVVRQNLFIDYPEVNDFELFAVVEATLSRPAPSELRVSFTGGTTSVVCPMSDCGCRFAFQLEETSEPAEPRIKSRRFVELHDSFYRVFPKKRLGEMITTRVPWFDGTVRDVGWSALIRFERRLAASFGRDNVWLAGDAAHLASPISGLSMNVGLREGQELAQIAADVVQGRATTEQLHEYGQRRSTEWHGLLDRDAEVITTPECDPWVAAHATRIVNCLPASGPDRTRLAKSLGLAFGVSDPSIA